MPLTRKATSSFNEYVQRQMDARIEALISMFEYVGNECVTEMRTNRRYIDRTGNLRSSTGFAVVYNGEIVRGSAFEQVGEGAEGTTEGQALIQEAAATAPANAVSLILVAGMNYAVYVESKGLNVMDSAKILAEEIANEMLPEIGFKRK